MSVLDASESIAELVCEFLEALTHEVLYLRQIYSREIFERERLYGIRVRKSRHPGLNQYISDSLLSLKDGIKHGKVQKVAVNVLHSGRIHEKFVSSTQVSEQVEVLDIHALENAFRGCLLKLQYADACMKPTPKGSTFEIEAHITSLKAFALDTWVEESSHETADSGSNAKSLIPIRSIHLPGVMKLQLHAEMQGSG